jgi:primosomal protein N' (replication factor Y) (superfamily II helicase)
LIVDVAVPVAGVEDALSYAVPRMLEDRLAPGLRVLVPVGSRRVVGLVFSVRGDEAASLVRAGVKLKAILEVLDASPVVDLRQLELARFVSSYYAADLGACARLVLPPDTGSVVERRFQLTERGEQARVFSDAWGLGRAEVALLEAFAPGERKGERKLARTRPQRERLAALVGKGLVEEVEAARAVGKVRHDEVVVPATPDDPGAQPLPKNTPALAAFDAWLRAVGRATMLEAQAAHTSARAKVKKLEALGRLRVERSVHVSAPTGLALKGLAAQLTQAQARACERILDALGASERTAFLLEGVTGSGKTEVYLRALRAALAAGRGALLIVPEIGLTPQLLGRVTAALADRRDEVVLLHSGVSAAERRDGLARLREGAARVVVGARSALFAPVRDLGLVVVDEEHDPSLKQDEAPRYHARDVALWRARHEGAVCVLGSATPSLESVHNARVGKLELLELPLRVGGGGAMPTVEVIDLRKRAGVAEARRRDRLNADEGPGVVLSAPLVEAMGEVLGAGDQVLLFLNKRGYAAAILCEMCGHIEQCPNCSVSLTLHRRRQVLVCHQCDHETLLASSCRDCGDEGLLALGLGTERLESEVKARFPDARVARLDRDSVRTSGSLERLLAQIHAREVDIIVGTQMVAKGHDFPGVRLVGVVLADVALALPDFRASERAFSLLAQVSGRAGRGEKPGRVLIQTYKPEAPAIAFALTHDVRGFAAQELAARELHRYPPFWRAALVRIEAEDAHAVPALAAEAASRAQTAAAALAPGSFSVLGPAPCALERLQGRTRWQVFVRTRTVAQRTVLVDAVRRDPGLARDLGRARARLIIDLDPIHLL